MILLRSLSRAHWVVGLSLVALIVVLLIVAVNCWGLYRSYHEQSKDLIPRIARLEGLAESTSMLNDANQVVDLQMADMVYTSGADSASIGAVMQQTIRGVFDKAGLTVSGSQILPPRIDKLFARIQLEVAATGSLESLEVALLELAELQPLVVVDSLNVQPTRARRGDASQKVNLRLRLTSLRMLP
jgi:hypothetical protein